MGKEDKIMEMLENIEADMTVIKADIENIQFDKRKAMRKGSGREALEAIKNMGKTFTKEEADTLASIVQSQRTRQYA